MNLQKFLLVFLISLSHVVYANKDSQLVERVVELQTKEKNPATARTELVTRSMEQLSEELIKEIIGDAKFARNRSLINQKVIKNASRYIPFSRPGDLKPTEPEGFSLSTVLRVNLAELQKMLLEQGLFYEQDGTPIVLPFIRWVDQEKGKNLMWWVAHEISDRGYLKNWVQSFESRLSESFEENQFYMIRPQYWNFEMMIPEGYKQSFLRTEDIQSLAQHFGAQIYIQGQVDLQKVSGREAYLIMLRLSAYQTLNGRAIADVVRQFETDSGAFEAVIQRKLTEVSETVSEDLSKQVLEAWKRGSLGSSVYRLTIKGRLPLQQQSAFKESLKLQVREIRSLRERVISQEGIEFEMDSTVRPEQLVSKFSTVQIPNFKISVQTVNEQGLVLKLER